MISRQMKFVEPLRIADARAGLYHLFVRDLVLDCSIGIHDHEHDEAQRVRFNLDLAVREGSGIKDDDFAKVVCYEKIVVQIRHIVGSRHFNLVETLAEDVSVMCLENPKVRSARVRVEKMDVFEDAASAGIEIERFNPNG